MISRLVFVFATVVGLFFAASSSAQEMAPPVTAAGAQNPKTSDGVEFKFRRGDDPTWAAVGLDESSWTANPARELPARDGIYWLRARVWVPAAQPAQGALPDGLAIATVASYDVFWDGKLIGRSGRVGTDRASEVPGAVDALWQIPDELLTPGEHVIALRISSFHTGFPSGSYTLNPRHGNFREMLVQRARTAILSLVAVGAALVIAVTFGLVWLLAGRRPPVLLFALLFASVAVMQGLQAWRWLYEYPYDWHYPRLVAITWLATAFAVLLPAFLLHHFAVPRRWLLYVILGGLLVVAWRSFTFYNAISLTACACGLGVALAGAIFAVGLRRRGSVVALTGLLLTTAALFAAPGEFLEHSFFLSFGPAMLALLTVLVLQMREDRSEAQRAQPTAARLQIELLKKNIQPHFLMNTLTTLMEVIEQDPKAAVRLIGALAEEFRLLERVSGESLISVGQEIELCRSHLQIMSLRRERPCSLRIENLDADAAVPPAVFLTLIENGLTHQPAGGGELVFSLRGTPHNDGGMTYEFFAPGGPASVETRATRDGTGLRYVKARLEESFPGGWRLRAGAVGDGWRTIIEIDPPRGESREPARVLAPVR